MVEELLKEAKKRRGSRTTSAFIVGGVLGFFMFVDVGTCLLAGLVLALVVWFYNSLEVDRLAKIQKPWRDK